MSRLAARSMLRSPLVRLALLFGLVILVMLVIARPAIVGAEHGAIGAALARLLGRAGVLAEGGE